jgi:hypothetical protein
MPALGNQTMQGRIAQNRARNAETRAGMPAWGASRQPGFAGVEPGGGFSTPPSLPGLMMDGQTPQGGPSAAAPPPGSRPARPRPASGSVADRPTGAEPNNLPVPPGGGGGWGPPIVGTPGQTSPGVTSSPFGRVRPIGAGWKNPGQGAPPLGKRPPITLGGPVRTIQSSQGPGGSSVRTQY